MLCPFRKRTIEYESQIGYGEKGDIIASFKEEHYMECNTECPYCEVLTTTYNCETIYGERKTQICRRGDRG